MAAFRIPDQRGTAARLGIAGSELEGFARGSARPGAGSAHDAKGTARRRLEWLFWHGLTALAFVAVVVLMCVPPAGAVPVAERVLVVPTAGAAAPEPAVKLLIDQL